MDTKSLIAEAKARFAHNLAKDYLKEKYEAKLLVADQGGLWKADPQTIAFLSSSLDEDVVLIDTFENPVKVNRLALLAKLGSTYYSAMDEWNKEWKELERKR